MPIHPWNRVAAGIFHHFHHEWISTITRRLNSGLLPRDSYALAERAADEMEPGASALCATLSGSSTGGGVALATAPPKARFTLMSDADEFLTRRKHIAIRHVSDDSVVAVLEIVSPGNKGSRGALKSFVQKAIELLRAGVHLLVIDLFPPTTRDPQGIHATLWSEIMDDEFRLPDDQRLTLAAYVANPRITAYVEPVAVGAELPEMPLFLTPDFYVPVPLAATYDDAFAAVPERWRAVLTEE